MRITRTPIGLVVWCALAAAVWPAAAQAADVARNFSELQGRVLTGETVTATDEAGQVVKGKLVSLNASALTLATKEGLRTLPGNELTKVQARRMGSLLNGAIIGGAVGLAPVVAVGADCHDCDLVGPGLLLTAMGVGIGVAIDALIWGNVTVMKTEEAGTKKVSLAPLVTRERKGVLLSVRY